MTREVLEMYSQAKSIRILPMGKRWEADENRPGFFDGEAVREFLSQTLTYDYEGEYMYPPNQISLDEEDVLILFRYDGILVGSAIMMYNEKFDEAYYAECDGCYYIGAYYFDPNTVRVFNVPLTLIDVHNYMPKVEDINGQAARKLGTGTQYLQEVMQMISDNISYRFRFDVESGEYVEE